VGTLRDGAAFELQVGRRYSGKAVALVFHARLSLQRYLELARHCQPTRRSGFGDCGGSAPLWGVPGTAAMREGHWRDRLQYPKREIYSFIRPRGYITRPGMPNHTGDHGDQYQGLLTR